MSLHRDPERLARAIVVRHREPGHLRFDLPMALADAATGAFLDGFLRGQAGVYRVNPTAGKLALWYDPHAASERDVAQRLRAALDALPEPPPTPEPEAPADPRPSQFTAVLEQARDQMDRFAARVEAASGPQLRPVVARVRPILTSALTEQAISGFLNDLVAFYLVKAHWDLITQRWLKEPIKYRNAWLTTFYLVLLLVRARKRAAAAR